MPFSSGTFSLYSTGNPVVTGTTISSSWANNTLSDIASGLSTCVLKDGTQTITANIPMGGFKLTGLAAGSAAGNSLRYEQLFTSGTVTLLGALTTAGTVTVPTGNVAVTTGIVSVPDGTAAAPSVKVGDEQNGLYSPAANQIAIVANTKSMLSMDATNNRVIFDGVSSGSVGTLGVTNSNNTAGSFAEMRATVGGASSADPFLSCQIASGQSWSLGLDNSDSDAFLISAATALGSSNRLRIDTTGAIQTGGTASAPSGYSSNGDIALPATGAVRAINTLKAAAKVTFSGGSTPTLISGFNVTSITDNGAGDVSLNLTNATADANGWPVASIINNYVTIASVISESTTVVRVNICNASGVLVDVDFIVLHAGS